MKLCSGIVQYHTDEQLDEGNGVVGKEEHGSMV
jgi:hypothetical protein